MASKKISNANLKADTAAKILNGGVSDEKMKTILNLTDESPDIVIRTVDILAGGQIKDHVTTKNEVIHFAAKCSDLDQLFEKMREERKLYVEQAARAANARKSKATPKGTENDKAESEKYEQHD